MVQSNYFIERQRKALGLPPLKSSSNEQQPDNKKPVPNEKKAAKKAAPKKKIKNRVPVKKVSDKEKQRQKDYRKARKLFLSKPENLQCKFPGCNQIATEVHHASGRIAGNLTDEKNMIGLCTEHHHWAHNNDAEARKLGLIKSRHHKNEHE